MARFRPFCGGIQTRFKFRHREVDPWRRLMDASFFQVNYITRTRDASVDAYGGHWSHIVTCQHVLMPWAYPNYYPPTGLTKYVSRVSMADCQIQVRINSLEGKPLVKHFASTYHTFHHYNKRLDIGACHPEQFFRRQGELKLFNAASQGLLMRPRLEIVEELKEGDHVWIYGMRGTEELFDEEKATELLMIPTAVKGRVCHKTKEVFFVDTSIDELHPNGVEMGMCGGPVMRNGKVVGMLTAKVHEESPNKDFAGRAMCCYSQDIFAFLLEVEQQMKNAPPIDVRKLHEAPFGEKVKEKMEEPMYRMHRDFDKDASRVARHVPVPISLWRRDREWVTEHEQNETSLFGRTSPFNQEFQEEGLGLDMNQSTDIHRQGSDRPEDVTLVNNDGSKPVSYGERVDVSGKVGVYLNDDFAKYPKSDRDHIFGKGLAGDWFAGAKDDAARMDDLHRIVKTMDNLRDTRAAEAMKESIGTEVEAKMRADKVNQGDFSHVFGRDGRIDLQNPLGGAKKPAPFTQPNYYGAQQEEDMKRGVERSESLKRRKSEVEDILDAWSSGS